MLRKRSSSSSLSQDAPLPTRMPMNPPSTSLELAHSPKFHDSPSEAAAVQNKGQQQHDENEGISDWEAGVSLAKAIMGAGSFALPWAFSKMGYIAGPIVLMIFLGLSVRSIGLLVDCARWLRRQTAAAAGGGVGLSPASSVSYVDVARATFGPTGAALAYAASIASSIGVCGSYLVFVAVNLSALLKGMTKTEITATGEDDEVMAISERKLFLLLVWTVALPIAVLLSSVRNPKRFAEVSLWGDLSVVAGMLAVVVYGVVFDERQSESSFRAGDCVAIGSPKDMALALGSIGYLFLVHFLVLPIESSMEGPKMGDNTGTPDAEAACSNAASSASVVSSNRRSVPTSDRSSRDRFQTVVTKTFVVCGSIGGIFGIIGYFLFGTNTQQIVLLNVEGSIGMAIVQSLLCIDLLLTYPVVMRPSIRILEEHWRLTASKKRNEKKDETHEERREDKMLQMVALVPSSGNAPETSFASSCSKRSAASASTLTSGAFGHLGDRESLANGVLPLGGDSNEEERSVRRSCDHMVVCVALGVVAAGAGSFVPAFGLLSGLVGGVSQTFLAFVLPPLMWAKQQHQSELSACACFGSLPWSEKSLVLCGLGLIGWTLQSTWMELGNKSH